MGLYTRRQLVLLLALLAASGIGLAVRHWRATHPDLAARLEQFDLEPAEDHRQRGEEKEPVSERLGSRSPKPPPPLFTEGDSLDLNRATADDLARLPGVGPSLAARIVAVRQAGTFVSVDDLARVKGLGRGRIERLRPLVTVGEELAESLTGSLVGSSSESE